jgi:hypothetical protein
VLLRRALRAIWTYLHSLLSRLSEPVVIGAVVGILAAGVGSWVAAYFTSRDTDQQIAAQRTQTKDQLAEQRRESQAQIVGNRDQAQTDFIHSQQTPKYADFAQNLQNARQIIELLHGEYDNPANNDPPDVSASHIKTLEQYTGGMNTAHAVIAVVGSFCVSTLSNNLLNEVSSIYKDMVAIRDNRILVDPANLLDNFSDKKENYADNHNALEVNANLFIKYARLDLNSNPFDPGDSTSECS